MAINNCFYIKNLGDEAINIRNGAWLAVGWESTKNITFDYSINNTTDWVPKGGYADPIATITLQPGDKVYFKGTDTLTRVGTNPEREVYCDVHNWFGIPAGAYIEAGGSVMSLVHDGDGDNEELVNGPAFGYGYCTFGYMFVSDSYTVDIGNLKLPSILFDYYFLCCFEGTRVVNCPRDLLPATELAYGCYNSMFCWGSGITVAPDLPAPVLVERCYETMFSAQADIREIHVGFTEWNNEGDSTRYWMSNPTTEGNFYCPDGLPEIKGENYIPENWNVHYPVAAQLRPAVSLGTYVTI